MTARTPIAIAAASARDRIGELWTTSMRTVEESLNKRNGADGNNTGEGVASGSRTPGSEPRVAGIPGTSPEANISLERLESVVRVMFGSCTTGTTGVDVNGNDLELDLQKSKSHHSKSQQNTAFSSSSWSPASRSRSHNNINRTAADKTTNNNAANVAIPPPANADHVYKQLFIDDQRSNKVFHQQPLHKIRSSPIRKPSPARNAGAGAVPQPPAPPPLPQPIIIATKPAVPPQPLIIATTKPTAHRAVTHPGDRYNNLDREDVAGDLSFDDGISAISALTLEEMARMQEMQSHRNSLLQQKYGSPRPLPSIEYSTDSSLFPPSTLDRNSSHRAGSPFNDVSQNDAERLGPSMSPVNLRRQGRSNGSRHNSFGSQSTRTSGEFASAWRRDEKKYWEDEVENDKNPGSTHSNFNKHKSNKIRSSSAVVLNGSVGCARVNSRKASRRRSRSRDSAPKCNGHQDLTITTASSSLYSRSSNSGGAGVGGGATGFERYHPHDVYHLESNDVITTSPLTTTPSYKVTHRPQEHCRSSSRVSESTTTTVMDHFTTKAGSEFKDYLVFPSVANGDVGEI